MTPSHRTDWFRDARWGALSHYLADQASATTDSGMTVDAWNRRVDSFDVHALAEQLASVGARYYYLTLGQNSGFYCSPNAVYDAIVGRQPSRCSRRDLIADLHRALHPKGIKLLAYVPAGAPFNDALAVEKLQWQWGFDGPAGTYYGPQRTSKRLAEFQAMWEAVLREWAQRWGDKLAGWWVDGCYFNNEMYNFPEPPNFQSLTAALRAGNPDAIVALNPGLQVPVICPTEYEDYTAGEIDSVFPVAMAQRRPFERWVGADQFHILSYLGEWWGAGRPRFPVEFVIGYTKLVNAREGVVTWDVPLQPDGRIPQPFVEQLRALREALA